MKKVLVTLMLALSTAAFAQTDPQPPATGGTGGTAQQGTDPSQAQQPGAQQGQPGQAGAQPGQASGPQQKTIKDPAEYNAYINAIQQQDPAGKAQALEQFITQYPQSVVREDAMEALMGAYQQQNNTAKMAEAAQRLLQVNANHVPALAVLALNGKVQAQQAGATNQAQAQQILTQAQQYAQRGVQAIGGWQKPEGVADADFQKQRSALTALFHNVAGLAAYTAKNHPVAQQHFSAALQANPNSLEDAYFLALSYFEAKPANELQGLWTIARATALAQGTPGEAQIGNYGRARYKKYHGSEEGWPELVQQARASATPPAGFTIKPAPTPAEVAGDVLSKYQPKELNFGDWQFILSSGNQQAAQQVWTHMKSLGLMKLSGKVIEATPERLRMAIVQDNQATNTADVELVLAEPVKTPPTVGAVIDVAGEAGSYTPDPILITMTNGQILTKAAPAKGAAGKKAPAKKPAAKKPAPKKR